MDGQKYLITAVSYGPGRRISKARCHPDGGGPLGPGEIIDRAALAGGLSKRHSYNVAYKEGSSWRIGAKIRLNRSLLVGRDFCIRTDANHIAYDSLGPIAELEPAPKPLPATVRTLPEREFSDPSPSSRELLKQMGASASKLPGKIIKPEPERALPKPDAPRPKPQTLAEYEKKYLKKMGIKDEPLTDDLESPHGTLPKGFSKPEPAKESQPKDTAKPDSPHGTLPKGSAKPAPRPEPAKESPPKDSPKPKPKPAPKAQSPHGTMPKGFSKLETPPKDSPKPAPKTDSPHGTLPKGSAKPAPKPEPAKESPPKDSPKPQPPHGTLPKGFSKPDAKPKDPPKPEPKPDSPHGTLPKGSAKPEPAKQPPPKDPPKPAPQSSHGTLPKDSPKPKAQSPHGTLPKDSARPAPPPKPAPEPPKPDPRIAEAVLLKQQLASLKAELASAEEPPVQVPEPTTQDRGVPDPHLAEVDLIKDQLRALKKELGDIGEQKAKPAKAKRPSGTKKPSAAKKPARPAKSKKPAAGKKPAKAYCSRCKAQRTVKNPKRSTLANGRKALRGTCAVCRRSVYRQIKA